MTLTVHNIPFRAQALLRGAAQQRLRSKYIQAGIVSLLADLVASADAEGADDMNTSMAALILGLVPNGYRDSTTRFLREMMTQSTRVVASGEESVDADEALQFNYWASAVGRACGVSCCPLRQADMRFQQYADDDWAMDAREDVDEQGEPEYHVNYVPHPLFVRKCCYTAVCDRSEYGCVYAFH